jgi:Rrf2 family protein
VNFERGVTVTRSSHPSRYALPGVVVPAQLDYAIRGLVSLALATDDRTKIEVLATDHDLSRKFLAQVLVTLRNAGIVTTHRGSDGGYGLARNPSDIRIIDVFDAVSPGVGYEPRTTNPGYAAALTQEAWAHLATAVRESLRRLTLADLTGVDTRERGDRTAGGMALEASDPAGDLRPGGREEVAVPRGA